MTALFLCQGVINILSLRQCIIVVQAFRAQSRRDDPNNDIMGPALTMKLKNLKYLDTAANIFIQDVHSVHCCILLSQDHKLRNNLVYWRPCSLSQIWSSHAGPRIHHPCLSAHNLQKQTASTILRDRTERDQCK